VALAEIIAFVFALHLKGTHRHKIKIQHLALMRTPKKPEHCNGADTTSPCHLCTMDFPIQVATLAAFAWVCA
jgi:hypothetical protein